ncbi:hypothetical protein Scep_013506 [Stephania cephalantha]|uniref:Uncharacterized protein n=1 Tax=Stephania cephalantha TaxID=152367 RepID=A0AAP0JH73_9MAGN
MLCVGFFTAAAASPPGNATESKNSVRIPAPVPATVRRSCIVVSERVKSEE